jgi:hypothetical protein
VLESHSALDLRREGVAQMEASFAPSGDPDQVNTSAVAVELSILAFYPLKHLKNISSVLIREDPTLGQRLPATTAWATSGAS